MQNEHGYFLEDLSVGMSEVFEKTVTDSDIESFAQVSGDNNPLHLDDDFASGTIFKGRIAHGMLSASYLSTIFGTRLPGPGCVYLKQSLRFKAPVRPGDTVEAKVTVKRIDEDRRRVDFECSCTVEGNEVLDGEATIMVDRRPS